MTDAIDKLRHSLSLPCPLPYVTLNERDAQALLDALDAARAEALELAELKAPTPQLYCNADEGKRIAADLRSNSFAGAADWIDRACQILWANGYALDASSRTLTEQREETERLRNVAKANADKWCERAEAAESAMREAQRTTQDFKEIAELNERAEAEAVRQAKLIDIWRDGCLVAKARIRAAHKANKSGVFWLSADESDRGGQWVTPHAPIYCALKGKAP